MIPIAPTSLPAAPNSFFSERRSFAEIKQEILPKYFETWCHTRIASQGKEGTVLYIDLHSGAMHQEQKNSAFYILERISRSAGRNPDLNERVRTFFGDAEKGVVEGLSQELAQSPLQQELVHQPLWLHEPENRMLLPEMLHTACAPLLFLNPFSYGHAQEVLLHSLRTTAADLLLLFSPDNITRAVAGKKVSQSLTEVFGARLSPIRAFCRKEKNQARRQEYILAHFTELLQEQGYLTLLFKINDPALNQMNHYLLFSSKEGASYRSFKEIMLTYSEFQADGVPLFLANQSVEPQLSLFPQRPIYTISNLVQDLSSEMQHYKYKSIEKIYEAHSLGTSYIRENYQAAFEQLREQGKIELLNPKTLQTIRKGGYSSVVKLKA